MKQPNVKKGGQPPLSIYSDLSRADWFVKSKNPMVVMRMPGCYRELVNVAHTGWLPLETRVAKSRRGFISSLKSLARSKLHSTICYCEEVDLIIALEREHCSFERCYDELKGSPFGTVASSLAFRLISQTTFRRYQICRAFILRDDAQPGLSLLETSLIPFPGLTLRVENFGEPGHSAPKAALELNGKVTQETEIYRRKVPAVYTTFHRLLGRSLEKLAARETDANVERWLLNEAEKTVAGYSQVISIISTIFKKKDGDRVADITRIRERIFDAMPAWEMKSFIDSFIRTEFLKLPPQNPEGDVMRTPYRIGN